MIHRLLVALLLLLPAAAHAEIPGPEAAAAAADAGTQLRRAATAHYLFEWHPDAEAAARSLLRRVEEHHGRIYAALGAGGATERTRVTILADAAEMRAFAARRHRGSTPPDWAGGLAYPASREIYLHADAPPSELDTTLQHEIAHVALGIATDDARVPRWFTEGVAIELSEGPAFERIRLLTEAALMDGLLDLDALDRGFPVSGARAGVAYAQAVHFVAHLRAEYGKERFGALIAALRDDRLPFADAVGRVYPVPLDEIERAWRADLRLWWGWLPVVFGSTTLWVAGALLVILGWRRRRGQQRRRMERMAAEEAAELADDVEVAGPFPPRRHLHDPYDGRPPTIH